MYIHKLEAPEGEIYRLRSLVTLLHCTSARIAEILALDLEQIDLEKCKFQVIGKGNKRQWCFYSEDAALILENYLKYYRQSGHQALFTSQQPQIKKISLLSYCRAYHDSKELIKKHRFLEATLARS